MQDFVETITRAIDSAQEPVVLIVHSRSGIVATQAAEERPDRIRTIAYLAAYLPPVGDTVSLSQARDGWARNSESLSLAHTQVDRDAGSDMLARSAFPEVLYALSAEDGTRLRVMTSEPRGKLADEFAHPHDRRKVRAHPAGLYRADRRQGRRLARPEADVRGNALRSHPHPPFQPFGLFLATGSADETHPDGRWRREVVFLIFDRQTGTTIARRRLRSNVNAGTRLWQLRAGLLRPRSRPWRWDRSGPRPAPGSSPGSAGRA